MVYEAEVLAMTPHESFRRATRYLNQMERVGRNVFSAKSSTAGKG